MKKKNEHEPYGQWATALEVAYPCHRLSTGRTVDEYRQLIEAYPWTSGGSIHHRQSVCAAKSSAIPTGPRPHLGYYRAIAGKVALEPQDKGVTCMHASVLCLAGINPAVFAGHNRNSATTQPTTHVYCPLRQWLVNCFVLANCFARCQFGCWVVVSLFSVLACELNPGWGDYGCFHPA